MGKSIYEQACEKRQPEILKQRSKLSYSQALKALGKIKESFSTEYVSIWKEVVEFIFEKEEESKTLEEILQKYKNKSFDEFELDSFCDAIVIFYDVTYEEIRSLYVGKEYWMSIGRLYQKK